MNRFTMICAIVLIVAPVPAFAQAGSTGGTIGKQDKSASGGEVPARARRAPRVRIRYVVVRERRVPSAKHGRFTVAKIKHKGSGETTGSSCARRIVGKWSSWASGLFGAGDTIFYPDGTAMHSSGIRGTWRCNGSTIVGQFGNDASGPSTVSADGKRIIGLKGNVLFTRQ